MSNRITITPAECQTLVESVETVWQAIAPDACEAFPAMRNVHAVEACIDADRLTMFDDGHGAEAQAIFRSMAMATSYAQALRYLARKVSLI
jgi:hypothetical protein